MADQKLGWQRPSRLERGDHPELADWLLASLGGDGPALVYDEGELYRYETNGLWRAVPDAEQSRVLQEFAGTRIRGTTKKLKLTESAVSGAMKLAAHKAAQPGFFAAAEKGLAFSNGFVTLNGKGVWIEEHSPKHRARRGYDFRFDEHATPEKWLHFLDGLFRDDEDRTEKIALIQEFFGCALIGEATRFQKFLIMTGAGSNGKSALLDIVRELFAAGMVQAIPPRKWQHAFTVAYLRGVLLNVVPDMPEDAVVGDTLFKDVVTGDLVQGEIKYGAAFSFKPIAAHVFACNPLPHTNDQSFGFWRRAVVVPFNRNFENDPERDKTIATTVIESERAAILVWMLAGAVRAIRQDAYTIPKSHTEALVRWQTDSNSVALFLEEQTTPASAATPTTGGHDWVKAETLYQLYKFWCERTNHKPVAFTPTFGARMKQLGLPSANGRKARYYRVKRRGDGDLN